MCVGWYSIFSFPHIKGAINFFLLLLSECNTHARTAERLGPDLANMQDELIYQTAASPRHSSDLHRSMPFQRMRDKVGDGESRWGIGTGKKIQEELLLEEILYERKKKVREG